MSDEKDGENENPLDAIRSRADELGLDGDERDDFVERRMLRAGFKKGPGEWISADDDDDDERDDDGEPMTRGDWRRMKAENKRKSVVSPPPRKTKNDDDDENDSGKTKGKKSTRKDPWW